jgi:hypothetical protein
LEPTSAPAKNAENDQSLTAPASKEAESEQRNDDSSKPSKDQDKNDDVDSKVPALKSQEPEANDAPNEEDFVKPQSDVEKPLSAKAED